MKKASQNCVVAMTGATAAASKKTGRRKNEKGMRRCKSVDFFKGSNLLG